MKALITYAMLCEVDDETEASTVALTVFEPTYSFPVDLSTPVF